MAFWNKFHVCKENFVFGFKYQIIPQGLIGNQSTLGQVMTWDLLLLIPKADHSSFVQ